MRTFRLSRQLTLAAAALALSASAFASGFQGATGAPGGDGPGGGGGGGAAIAANLNQIGITASNNLSLGVNSTSLGVGGASTAYGGLGGVGLGGTGVGGTGTGGSATGGQATIGAGAVQVNAGNSVYKAAAAPSYAPVAHGPLKSCRLYAGIGGASRDGSGSAGIPIGNDQVCITDANHEIMDRENQRNPGTFSRDDYLRASCKVEGMSDTKACKELDGREPRQTASTAYVPN